MTLFHEIQSSLSLKSTLMIFHLYLKCLQRKVNVLEAESAAESDDEDSMRERALLVRFRIQVVNSSC